MLGGFVQTPGLQQDHGQSCVSFVEIRFFAQRLAEVLHGLIQLPLIAQDGGQAEVSQSVVRLDFEDLDELIPGFCGPAQLPERIRQVEA